MSNFSSQRDVARGVKRSPPTAAARFAQSRSRALGCLVAGGLLLPATLAAFWLKSGRLSGRAIVVAVAVSTLVALLGAAQLIVRWRAMQRHRAHAADKTKGGTPGTPLQVHFCKRSLGRLGPGVTPLLSGLRERGHTPVVRECLNCCQDCNLGLLVTMVDGTPMSATDGPKLLRDLDELAAAES